MSFQVLVDIADNQILKQGLVLPTIFNNKLTNILPNVKIIDYNGSKYQCSVQINQNVIKLCGAGWEAFAYNIKDKNVTTLCFTWKKKTKYQVTAYNSAGIELQTFARKPDSVYSCLVQVTNETCSKQDLPEEFLSSLTKRESVLDNLTAMVHRFPYTAEVVIFYNFPPNDKQGLASGFIGNNWKRFCIENDIEHKQRLLLTNMGETDVHNFNYDIQVFNSDGLALSTQPEHRCENPHHYHNKRRPIFIKQFESRSLNSHIMTIPRKFVHENKLCVYPTATLRFQRLSYPIPLRERIDPQDPVDKTQLHMIFDWQRFLNETGFSLEKVLRFELQQEKSIPGEMIYFDVC